MPDHNPNRWVVLSPLLLMGCIEAAHPPTGPAAPAKVDTPPRPAEAEPAGKARAAEAHQDKPKKAPPLTDEDRRLIAADPKDLTVDERRMRGHALRKKIMQNPDSPQAKQLEELRKAAERGEIELPKKNDKGMILHADGKQPAPDTKK